MWEISSSVQNIVCNNDENLNNSDDFSNSENNANRIRRRLNLEAQKICFNVYKNLREKFGFDEKTEIMQAVCDLTEVPLSTIHKIAKNGPYERKKRCDKGSVKPLDASLIKLLKTTIYDCYRRNELPTIEIIRNKLTNASRNVNCCQKPIENWDSNSKRLINVKQSWKAEE
jgi:hypothetical protein